MHRLLIKKSSYKRIHLQGKFRFNQKHFFEFWSTSPVTICLLSISSSLEIRQVARHRPACVSSSSIPPFDSFCPSLRRRRISSPIRMPVIAHKTLSTIPLLTNSLLAFYHRILPCFIIIIPCYPVPKNHYRVYVSHSSTSSPIVLITIVFSISYVI